MLARFKLIAAVDAKGGIGKEGRIPWHNPQDLRAFREKTMGCACIMGRSTYLSLPKALDGRTVLVVTSSPLVDALCYPSLKAALAAAASLPVRGVYVCGGERIYDEALRLFGYLCTERDIARIPGDWACDRFLARHDEALAHPEREYLHALQRVLAEGVLTPDRTGVGTLACFAPPSMRFDLRAGFPLLTTKRMSFKIAKAEFEFMWSGATDTRLLAAQGVHIWDANTSHEFLAARRLPWRAGDMGPSYGFQWRHAGTTYRGCDADYAGQGVDQIEALVQGLKQDPSSRRHMLTAWSPADLADMALPPCHCMFQCHVEGDHLDGLLYQRSADMFLGVPYNIAFYSLMLHRLASLSGLRPRFLTLSLGNAHVYSNHVLQAHAQLERQPLPLPTLSQDFTLVGYTSHPALSAPMAV